MMKIKFTNTENALLITIISISISIVGMHLNWTVVDENNCKMPVWTNVEYETKTHFSFQEWNKPEHWYLADIFHINGQIYSIGDLLMYQVFILGLPAYCLFLYFKVKDGRKKS